MATAFTLFPNLENEVQIPQNGILSRTLYNDDHLKLVLFGFAEGQELSAHTAPMAASLYFVKGEVQLTLGAEVSTARQGAFVHMPPQLKGVAGGKPWVRIDRGTLQALAGSQLGVPGLGTTLDFSNVLAWLRGVSGQITTVGNESIHGTETTHYRAQVDLSRVAATMGADANDDSALAPSDGRTLPIDVWIDPQGRLRQLKVSLDLNTLPLPQGVTLPTQALGTAVLTVDLWNFGVTVHAVPPPANQVSDASSLIGGGAGRAG